MEFILQDGYIHIVKNIGLANSTIEANVVINNVGDYQNKQFFYSVNDSVYNPIKDGKITILKTELSKPYVDLKIKAVGKDSVEVFKADRVPVTFAVIFGENMDEAYPEKLKELEKKVNRLSTEADVKFRKALALAEANLEYIKTLEAKGSLL